MVDHCAHFSICFLFSPHLLPFLYFLSHNYSFAQKKLYHLHQQRSISNDNLQQKCNQNIHIFALINWIKHYLNNGQWKNEVNFLKWISWRNWRWYGANLEQLKYQFELLLKVDVFANFFIFSCRSRVLFQAISFSSSYKFIRFRLSIAKALKILY